MNGTTFGKEQWHNSEEAWGTTEYIDVLQIVALEPSYLVESPERKEIESSNMSEEVFKTVPS